MAPQIKPVSTQAARATTIPNDPEGAEGHAEPAPAVMAPIKNCPSPPMLKSPARKATATARPVKIRGVAVSRVRPTAVGDPKAPRNSAPKAATGLLPVASMITAPMANEMRMAKRGKTSAPAGVATRTRRRIGARVAPSSGSRASCLRSSALSRGLLRAPPGHEQAELLVGCVGADLAHDPARVNARRCGRRASGPPRARARSGVSPCPARAARGAGRG